jgi:EmrB/QacA subfamily drug resistance transporter
MTESSTSAATEWRSSGWGEYTGSKWWTLVAVCLGTFMLLLDVTIVNVALPDVQKALGSSFAGLQWVVDAYALALASLMLATGSLADLYGRRRLYLCGLTVFGLASLLCGLATTTLMLQLSRGLQGIGGATMFSVSLALLADAFRGRDRGAAFGVWGAVTGLAVAIGPVLGGVLTSGLSWRWIFFVNVPVGAVAVVITVLKVAESKVRDAHRPDIPGFVVFTLALAATVFALIESNRRSFGSPIVIASFAAAAVLLIAFVLIERTVQYPMFDLGLFRLPTFTGGAVAAFAISASIFSTLLYVVLYLQNVLGLDALGAGVRLLLMSAGILLTTPIAGRLSARVPVRWLIGPGLLLIGVGLLLMRGLGPNSGWAHLIAGLVVAGAGSGLVNPPLASTAVGVVTPERSGMASGINSTFRQVGIATGIALLGTLFANRVTAEVLDRTAGVPGLRGQGSRIASAVTSGHPDQVLATLSPADRSTASTIIRAAFTSGLNWIFLIAAIVAFVGGVVALLAIRQRDFVATQRHQGGRR